MADDLAPMAAETPDIVIEHAATPTKSSALDAKGARGSRHGRWMLPRHYRTPSTTPFARLWRGHLMDLDCYRQDRRYAAKFDEAGGGVS